MSLAEVFTPEARDDLFHLYDYLAEYGSPARTLRFIERIEQTCMSLSCFPERGTLREDLRSGLCVMGFERRVLIAFRVDSDSVAILRILYGGRSLEHAFAQPDIE